MKEKIKPFLQRCIAVLVSRKKLVLVGLFILVIAGVVSRRFLTKDEQATFITAQVERTTLINSVSASGSVINTGQQTISTKASGVVRQIFVKDGDAVAKGNKLVEFELDQEGEEARAKAWSSYLSSKNSVESTKATQYSLQSAMFEAWDEFKELAESDTYQNSDGTPKYEQRALPEFHIPEKDWLAAEAKYKNQVAVIAQAQAALTSSWLSFQMVSPTITAPASGKVSDVMVAPGIVISPQTGEGGGSHKLLSLVTGQEALVSVSVSEIDVSHIETGQKVIIVVDAVADKTFTGKVVGIDRTGSVTQGVVNYAALISLDTLDKSLLPNMSITAEIILSSKPNVLVVPAGAVSQFQGQAIVSVLVNGKPQEKEVETGLQTPTQVEILNGLEEGETVITGRRQTSEAPSQFGGQGRRGFGGGALRPGGFGGGSRGGSGDQH